MATASDVSMLRAISAAGDRERTGALDVEWEGSRATLFFVFGHPNHVVYEASDGRKLAGETALDAIVDELPSEFRVAPWRRAMVTDDTLRCSAEDLMGLFQRRKRTAANGTETGTEASGEAAVSPPAPADQPTPDAMEAAAAAAEGTAPPPESTTTAGTAVAPGIPVATTNPLPFGPGEFPLLPMGTVLWSDAAARVVNLEAALPRLPDCLLVLTGAAGQGAAIIAGGRLADAVWVTESEGLLGDEAAPSLLTATEGKLTGYGLDQPRLLAALPMLWRSAQLGSGIPASWLNVDDIVAEVRSSGRSCALLVDSREPGVALFDAGELVAVYTAGERWPATSMTALRSLVSEDGATVTALAAPPTIEDAEPAVAEPTGEAAEIASEEVAAPEGIAEDDQVAATAATEVVGAPAEQAEDTAAEVPATTEEAEPGPVADAVAAVPATEAAEPEPEPEPVAEATAETPATDDQPEATAPEAETVAAVAAEPVATTETAVAEAEPASAPETEVLSTAELAATGDETPEVQPVATWPGDDRRPEPAVFTLPSFTPEPEPEPEVAAEESPMAGVEAREATEFVPAKLEIDVDALRGELTDIAVVWLGADDAKRVSSALAAARPGVDDFVSAIRSIGAMEIPGHDAAVVRAMAREMHFRASEVLCGV